MTDSSFSITPIDKSNLLQLSELWRAVESTADNSFFISWAWISNWINTIPDPVYLLKYMESGSLSLGILCHQKTFLSSTYLLNKTGSKAKDQIWIEHNALLHGPSFPKHINLLKHFSEGKIKSSLVIGVSQSDYLSRFDTLGYIARCVWRAPSYSKKLTKNCQDYDYLLNTFSKNTKTQIKRSYKYISSLGEVELRRATSQTEALVIFKKIAGLHKNKWGDSSGFSNPYFVKFHTQLVKAQCELGLVDLVSLELDGKMVAGLYNFVYKDKAYFYLSGIDYSISDNKFKPGLLIHTLIMQQYAKDNIAEYDFMAGEARYKKSLADTDCEMQAVYFERDSRLNRFLNNVRCAKSRFRFG
ncbi:GNAT family N-acetyltransferase [Catenovulum maritimum]|uniref:BioF2-like acetyltransferase domain-containing protein n=1 Tax=Catenovulum maritimum TaxID=1513271 RepID=A0A0J8JJL1_9ALTE|nr:GNAT family N-acetyltransferase [Catenovulum maritimum]KMT64631.1 hypothetical protein XM47_13390 [Catenovulum maritimum]